MPVQKPNIQNTAISSVDFGAGAGSFRVIGRDLIAPRDRAAQLNKFQEA